MVRLAACVVAGLVPVSALLSPAVAQSAALTIAATGSVARFDFDPGHTHLGFSVRHMMVTNVKGKFREFDGHVMFDSDDPTRSVVKLTIQTASLDTDHERRDADLRSERFFDVVNHPTLAFESTRIEKTPDGWSVTGNLTIREATKEVSIPVELIGPHASGSGQRILGVEGSLRIIRQDFGLVWNRAVENGVLVGDEVKIEIAVEARTPRPAG